MTYRVTYPNGTTCVVQAVNEEQAVVRANRVTDWRKRYACSGKVELVTGKKGKGR